MSAGVSGNTGQDILTALCTKDILADSPLYADGVAQTSTGTLAFSEMCSNLKDHGIRISHSWLIK